MAGGVGDGHAPDRRAARRMGRGGGVLRRGGAAQLGGQVALKDQMIQVGGDMAYEMGLEDGNVTLGGTRW